MNNETDLRRCSVNKCQQWHIKKTEPCSNQIMHRIDWHSLDRRDVYSKMVYEKKTEIGGSIEVLRTFMKIL